MSETEKKKRVTALEHFATDELLDEVHSRFKDSLFLGSTDNNVRESMNGNLFAIFGLIHFKEVNMRAGFIRHDKVKARLDRFEKKLDAALEARDHE